MGRPNILLFITDQQRADSVGAHFGRRLVPLLTGKSSSHRDAAFSKGGFRLAEEPQNEPAATYPYDVKTSLLHERPALVGRAIATRTPEWTFVHRTCKSDELYDRHRDARETTNVADPPENLTIVVALRDRILTWLVDTSDVVPLDRDPCMAPELVETFLPGAPGSSVG